MGVLWDKSTHPLEYMAPGKTHFGLLIFSAEYKLCEKTMDKERTRDTIRNGQRELIYTDTSRKKRK